MATHYSDWATAAYPFGSTATRCYLSVSEPTLSPTSVRVDIAAAAQSKATAALDGWGVEVTTGFRGAATRPDGSKSATGVMSYDSWVADVWDYWYFERTHSDYTVTLYSEYAGATVDGCAPIKQSGGVTHVVTIPAKPSYAVAFNANGGTGAPATATKWHGEALTLPAAKPARAHHTFAGWATSSNAAAPDYQAGGTYAADAPVTLYAVWRINPPAAPTGCTATRETDYRAAVAWTPGANAAATYAAVLVERSEDGGGWVQVAKAAPSATSWSDSTIAPNHAYRYRVRASNAAGQSAYAEAAAPVFTAPAAPTSVAAARLDAERVRLTIANPARTATALELQRTQDPARAWESLPAVAGHVTEAVDAPKGGTWYYRARNTRGSLMSAWSPASNAVVTICAPAAPTPTDPAQGSAVLMGDAHAVRFRWLHNALDGSAQTAAEVRWKADGAAAWKTLTATDATELTADIAAAGLNSTVLWQVRTKGAHADWSPWSAVASFRLLQVPSVAFAADAPPAAIEVTPIPVRVAYSDPSGRLAGCTLTVRDSMGAAVYSADMGTATELTIGRADWLPENGAAYTFEVAARSTTGLTAAVSRAVPVRFKEPQAAELTLAPNPEAGSMGVQVAFKADATAAPAVSAIIKRVGADGSEVTVGEGLQAGAYVEDRFAPLNVAYAYRVTTFADSGAPKTVEFPAKLETRRAFFIGSDATAWAELNPSLSQSYARPNRRLVAYIGREKPVAYDGVQLSRKLTYSARIKAEQIPAFRALMAEGRCVFKSHGGDVVRCVCDVAFDRAPLVLGATAGVTVSMTETDGDAL